MKKINNKDFSKKENRYPLKCGDCDYFKTQACVGERRGQIVQQLSVACYSFKSKK